jgi:uncharacterized protein YndB with AHSA1/START domain
MTEIRVVRDYRHAPAKVWRALTDPALMALWGMRPEGFAPEPGTRFRLVGAANRAWRGWVECAVLEVVVRQKLRFSWDDDGRGKTTYVTYSIEPHAGGTRLVFEHTGFTGIGGFVYAKALMTPGMKKVLGRTLPAVFADIDDEGSLRPGSKLTPLYPKSPNNPKNPNNP